MSNEIYSNYSKSITLMIVLWSKLVYFDLFIDLWSPNTKILRSIFLWRDGTSCIFFFRLCLKTYTQRNLSFCFILFHSSNAFVHLIWIGQTISIMNTALPFPKQRKSANSMTHFTRTRKKKHTHTHKTKKSNKKYRLHMLSSVILLLYWNVHGAISMRRTIDEQSMHWLYMSWLLFLSVWYRYVSHLSKYLEPFLM